MINATINAIEQKQQTLNYKVEGSKKKKKILYVPRELRKLQTQFQWIFILFLCSLMITKLDGCYRKVYYTDLCIAVFVNNNT